MTTRFRLAPRDDYSTDKGETLESCLLDELQRDPAVSAAAVRLVMCKLFELKLIDNSDVLAVLNTGRHDSHMEWEVAE